MLLNIIVYTFPHAWPDDGEYLRFKGRRFEIIKGSALRVNG